MVWVGGDLKDHLVPTSLPWAGTPGCSNLHPAWPWALPGRGQPQLLWATCSSVSSPSWWRMLDTFGVGSQAARSFYWRCAEIFSSLVRGSWSLLWRRVPPTGTLAKWSAHCAEYLLPPVPGFLDFFPTFLDLHSLQLFLIPYPAC